jgi:hypothetical protein
MFAETPSWPVCFLEEALHISFQFEILKIYIILELDMFQNFVSKIKNAHFDLKLAGYSLE